MAILTIGLCLLAGKAAAQALPPGAEACLDAIDTAGPTADEGEYLPPISTHCPEFVTDLQESPWADNLREDWDFFLSRAGLAALIDATSAYEEPQAADLEAASLRDIVAGLEPFETEPPESLWDQLVDWINSWFESEDSDRSWLGDWLASLQVPESWIRPILYVVVGLIVITVIAIVVNELRLGGAFVRGKSRALRESGRPGADIAGAATPSFEAIATAGSLRRKVELLFALTVERIARRQPGTLRPGSTHREIAAASIALNDAGQRQLAAVASGAERVTYGGWQPDDRAWDELLADGEQLVRQLDDREAGQRDDPGEQLDDREAGQRNDPGEQHDNPEAARRDKPGAGQPDDPGAEPRAGSVPEQDKDS